MIDMINMIVILTAIVQETMNMEFKLTIYIRLPVVFTFGLSAFFPENDTLRE